MAPDSIHTEITIDADAATVFAFFTEPERLIRWIGVSANLDPKPGGLFLVDVVENRIARGEYKEVVPVSRLVFTWGFEGSPTVAPGSSLVEIDLVPNNGATLVKFNHRGLPLEAVEGHREGWNNYLGRLALVARGIDPGPDPLRSRASQRP
jgi:uncharacterized protein YndB with AHSA1/START domain